LTNRQDKLIKKYFRKEETPGGFKVYVETKKEKLERSISRECTKLEENVKRVEQSISDAKAVQKRLREDFEKSNSRRLVDFEKEMKRLRDLYDAEGERLNQKLIEDLDKNGAVDEKERELSDIKQQLNETKEYLDDLRNMNLGTTEQHTMIISGPNKLTDEQIGSLRDAGATVTPLLKNRFVHRDVDKEKPGKNGC
jgi:chromosome segregation ATPase